MDNKFQGKYRIPSARWQHWDYRWSGAYFITICTKNREHYLGNITNGEMHLSDVGKLANTLWYEINNHTSNVELGEFVVMPNHLHMIIILNGGDNVGGGVNVTVETGHALSLPPQPTPTIGQKRFQNIGNNSVSSIIGSYKSAITKHARRLGLPIEWQPRFHDHVIRNNAEYQHIAQYILNNPQKWNSDRFYNL